MKSQLRFSLAIIALGGGLALAGCSSAADGGSSNGAVPAVAQQGGAQAEAKGGDSQVNAGQGAAGQDSAAQAQSAGGAGVDAGVGSPAAGETRYAIVTGNVTLTSDDPVATGDTVTKLVGDAGGRIDSMGQTSDTYNGGGPRVTLTLRVPTDKVTSVVDSLRTLGTVESVDLNSEDVTGTVVDLDARIASQELSVARVQDMLAKATTTTELLTVEKELATRQADLESMKSQRASLGDQTSLSTIDLTIQMPEDYVAPVAQDNGVGARFLDGWNALVSTLAAIVGVLAMLAPWLVVAGIVALAARWGVKRYRASGIYAKRAELRGAAAANAQRWQVPGGQYGQAMPQAVPATTAGAPAAASPRTPGQPAPIQTPQVRPEQD